MANFFRVGSSVIVAVGAGVAIGVSATLLYHRLSRSLSQEVLTLSAQVDRLCREVEQLRSVVETKKTKRKSYASRGYYSVHASSGEDDDVYEEARGESDFEPIKPLSSTSEEYLSFVSSNGSIPDSASSTVSQFFSRVDQLLEGTDEEKQQGYELLRDKEGHYSRNANFLWRMGKAMFNVAKIEGSKGNTDMQKRMTYMAKDTVEGALTVDQNNSSVQKWYAILIGSVADYGSTQDRIEMGFKFKTHIEKAIELNPKDPSAYYLLGRWCFGVSMLSWIERQLAATLFATPPTATVEEALQHFLEAERLDPEKWKDNMLFIAKCHIQNRDYSTAMTWLDKADQLPCISQDDKESQTEIDKLVYQYSYYRS